MGVIKSISKNLIIVHGDDGNIYKLYLGSCSRIEAVDRIPVVGDRIVFKGTKKAELTFNIYSVSSLWWLSLIMILFNFFQIYLLSIENTSFFVES